MTKFSWAEPKNYNANSNIQQPHPKLLSKTKPNISSKRNAQEKPSKKFVNGAFFKKKRKVFCRNIYRFVNFCGGCSQSEQLDDGEKNGRNCDNRIQICARLDYKKEVQQWDNRCWNVCGDHHKRVDLKFQIENKYNSHFETLVKFYLFSQSVWENWCGEDD